MNTKHEHSNIFKYSSRVVYNDRKFKGRVQIMFMTKRFLNLRQLLTVVIYFVR